MAKSATERKRDQRDRDKLSAKEKKHCYCHERLSQLFITTMTPR